MRREFFVGLTAMTLLSVGTGCNRRVFQEVLPVCETTLADEADIAGEKAADILIVVDNSGSMQEEQDRLAEAFINDNPAECPIRSEQIRDFAECDSETPPEVCRYSNPSTTLLETPGPEGLAQCGFIQVLAAFENDFRIGVITTDVGECDNRFPQGQADQCVNNLCGSGAACASSADCIGTWGHHPQRGCLQPNGPLNSGAPKIITRQDLLDDDGSNDDIAARFIATLDNVRTFGTGVERGLDAVDIFLDPDASRAATCEGDLASFLRDDAQLLVIFLTDEEDCSRSPAVSLCTSADECKEQCGNPEGCEVFPCTGAQSCVAGMTEFLNDSCGENVAHVGLVSDVCYSEIDRLTPVQHYVDRLKARKSRPEDVKVAVIAGGLADADGTMQPAACSFDAATGVADGNCDASLGNTANSNRCGPGTNCCFADAGSRYFQLADDFGVNQSAKDTICVNSFNQTMIRIAVLIADVDSLRLTEPPEDQSLIVVEKAPADGGDFVRVPRAAGTTCDGAGDGWVLEVDNQTIRFCGTARPLPGEKLRVAAAGKGANGEGPDACENRGTTRD